MVARSIRVAPAPDDSVDGIAAEKANRGPCPGPPRQEYTGVKRVLYSLMQCEESGVQFPKYAYRPGVQVSAHGCCALVFAGFSALLFQGSASTKEVSIIYSPEDMYRVFSIDEDLEGDVWVWYDLPELRMNQKRFIESKDAALFSGMFQTYSCEECLNAADAQSIRGSDPSFMALLPDGADFSPCGLASVSMFIDEYRLQHASGSQVAFDESDLVLPADRTIYDGKFVTLDNPAGPYYSLEGKDTWIGGGSFMEHMKVWFRSQAAPHVRHLWARIRGGLQAGEYNVTFPVNSPIWTSSWKVPEKRIVLSEANAFGSAGACEFLASICSLLVVVQAAFGAVHLSAFLAARG